MSLHPEFAASPYATLEPEQRWFPAAEELRASAYEKLLPPLAANIRGQVEEWRDSGYLGASTTSIRIPAKKSLFNKIVGEPNAGGFELIFAKFLDDAPDVAAFAKNYLAVGLRFEYVKADGDLSNYIPDFIVKADDGSVWIVAIKGRAELDLPRKMARLRLWCEDATGASRAENGSAYRFVYVDKEGFERNPPADFAALAASFTEYRETAP